LKLVNEQRDQLSKLIQEPDIATSSAPPDHSTSPADPTSSSSHSLPLHHSLSLPGATKHKILTLTDNEFDDTKVSEMVLWYSDSETTSGQGFNCPGDFGNALISRWRGTRRSYCASDGSPSASTVSSSIDCYPIKQTRHYGGGDNLCHLHGISMNVGLFGQEHITSPVIQRYVETIHEVLPYVHYPKGFIRSTCQPVKSNWIKETLPGWNADLVMNALESVSPTSTGHTTGMGVQVPDAYDCEEWVDHNVLIVQRDTFANFFHDSEDFVNVFLALAILEWKRGDTQMLLTDLYPKGPFWYFLIHSISHILTRHTISDPQGHLVTNLLATELTLQTSNYSMGFAY
jgi:hypothetical protein